MPLVGGVSDTAYRDSRGNERSADDRDTRRHAVPAAALGNQGQMALAAGHGQEGTADDATAHLVAQLADIGMSPVALWYIAGLLYTVGGLLVIALSRIDPTLAPHAITYLGCGALGLAALNLLVGRFLGDSKVVLLWAPHLLLVAGLAIYFAGVLILHAHALPYALLPLLTVAVPSYMYTWRAMIGYVIVAFAIVSVDLLSAPGPARVAHAIVTMAAYTAIVAGVSITRHRTRRLAAINRKLAYTDPLTGIANMRRLRETVATKLGAAGDDRPAAALFAIDLDNFKEINDRFDHSVGDQVLRAVATALVGELQPCDVAARRGGDEFSVLVVDPAGRDLDELRDRLSRAIHNARMATCPQITPSGGVAYVRTRADEELAITMERADQALHEVKVASREHRQGRASASAKAAQEQTVDTTATDVQQPQSTGGAAAESEVGRPARGRSPMRAVRRALLESNPDWTFAALLLAIGPIVTGFVSVANLVRPFTPAAGLATASGSMTLAVACVWAGATGRSTKWLHIPWLAAYGLLAIEISLAGRSGAALLDLLPAIVMYGFLLFNARSASLYMLLGDAMFGFFAIGHNYAEGTGRTVISIVVVAAVGGLIAKVRLVTVGYARTNIELSERDELTGVANMRALRSKITDVIERARSRQLRPILVAIDLDEFKQVNDRLSHSTGDRMLVAVSRAVSERVRIDELVARRGGDEFAVVISDGDAEYADVLTQRIADGIALARRRMCPDLKPTASVAAVQWHPGETPDELLRQADTALHRRKAAMHSNDTRTLLAQSS
jgi:diguanylate cyclase (GGDEF)-like protein